MGGMFQVRALAPTSSRESPSLRWMPLASSPQPTAPLSPPAAPTSPRILYPPCDAAGRGELQPAADPRHVQSHNHDGHVWGACPRPDLSSREPFLDAACAPPPRTALSPPGPHLPLASYAHLATRQYASAFNQPLTLDTSKVTIMEYMFWVRTLAPTSSREPFPAVPLEQPPRTPPLTSRPAPRPCFVPPAPRPDFDIHMPSPSGALSPCPALNLQPDPLPCLLIASSRPHLPVHAPPCILSPSLRLGRRQTPYPMKTRC